MAKRWSGIVEGVCSNNSKAPNKVMASLCLSPVSPHALMVPSRNAIFFVGDRAQGTQNIVIERLSQLESIAAILVSKLEPHANVWVVEPSFYTGPFACYANFLPRMTSRGEPLEYQPQGFPAATACLSLLASCIKQVTRLLTRGASRSTIVSAIESGDDTTSSKVKQFPETSIFGFSKGGVVLNQLLSELSFAEESTNNLDIKSPGHCSSSRSLNCEAGNNEDTEGCSGSACSYEYGSSELLPEKYLLPPLVHGFLGSIDQFHFLDVGLNRQGAYITHPGILDAIARVANLRQGGMSVSVHGTPRQWKDLRRPWILAEKDRFVMGLQLAAENSGNKKLRVVERDYFCERPASLQMHFEVIEAFIVD